MRELMHMETIDVRVGSVWAEPSRSSIERVNEFVAVRRTETPVYVPPLVGFVPQGRIDEVGAWLLALRLTEAGTWDCLIGWVRTSPPLNGHPEMHAQEIGWVPASAVRKLLALRDAYDRVPRLR